MPDTTLNYTSRLSKMLDHMNSRRVMHYIVLMLLYTIGDGL